LDFNLPIRPRITGVANIAVKLESLDEPRTFNNGVIGMTSGECRAEMQRNENLTSIHLSYEEFASNGVSAVRRRDGPAERLAAGGWALPVC
jgi:hypothetical protein